jgi:hypothetical protein
VKKSEAPRKKTRELAEVVLERVKTGVKKMKSKKRRSLRTSKAE